MLVACYSQLLAAFYNIPPHISKTSTDTALRQSEELINLATELGCVHLLGPHLAASYAHHRQRLFEAIKTDPARWLRVALTLQNRAVYDECVIHMVGAHPLWPRTWGTPRTAVPEAVRRVVALKAEELDRLRADAERALLLLTLSIGDMGGRTTHAPDPRQKSELETWLATQYFRDQVARHISKVEAHPQRTLHWGTLYRGIFSGRLPWLETEMARETCGEVWKGQWRDLGEDMVRLREGAKRAVERLARNELMIEPDRYKVGYLTCVKVRDEDVPWLGGDV